MGLQRGDKLGRYEVISLLGKGGIVEVWKARDPRLYYVIPSNMLSALRGRTILLACVLAVCGQIDGQVLNMSHDLVSLGIASQNLMPNNPSLDSTPLFQAALNYVQNHPVQTLTLDTGAYYLLSYDPGIGVLFLNSLSNMTIDLAGSTIYFNGPQLNNGLVVWYCSNLTLTNFTVDYVHPPYTHVQLVSVDTVNRLLKYQTLAGWPDPATLYSLSDQSLVEAYWGAIFRNGSIVPETSRTLLQGPFTNNTITIQDQWPWALSATLSTLQAGDTVVVSARGGGPPIEVIQGDGITISNITIYGSAEVGVQLSQTSNSTVDSVRTMPRPGSGLIGSVAGITLNHSGQNNHIRNCYVARTMDDGIAINYDFATVVSQPDTLHLTVTRDRDVHFPNGTLMNYIDPVTQVEYTGAPIVSQSPPDSTGNIQNGNVDLTFGSDLPLLAPGTILVLGSPALRGQGSTIEDNLVEDTYGGRGVWLAGVEGVTVQRNVLRRTSQAGIVSRYGSQSIPALPRRHNH
jgi:hypothetical protein